MRKLASVLFLLLAVTANLFAQVGPTSGGGGSVSSGSAIGSCTSSILYTDASTLLGCNPAAVVNGSVSTAGRSILTIRDTWSSGQSMLNLTGTMPSVLSAPTSGVLVSVAGDDDAQPQYVIQGAVTGSTPNGTSAGVFGANTATGGTRNWGVFGYSSGAATGSAGVVGIADNATSKIGGWFSLGVTTPSGTSALVADNQAVAANIFEARDNGTAVFTIADSGIAKFDFAGSATAPTIGASSDCCDGSGTGWYHPAVNDWRFTSNGTDLIYFGAYVGLNTFLQMNPTSTIRWQPASWSGGTSDLILTREAAAILQIGEDVNGAAVNQTLKAHDGITGTDVKGASLTLAPGLGTGAAVSNPLTLNRVVTKATGTTAQTYSPAMVYCPTKILSNTSATAQTIATITTTSTTGGSVTMDYTTVANNGTLQDTDSGMVKVSWNNNAGTVAAAMTAVALQSDSDASGTLATTPTATVATNVVSIKFTPTWVTIVPTTVTGWATFTLHTSGDTVACQ